MRLTAELIQRAPDIINPCKDRELNLRGNKIAMVENLGATKDQFDTIDFSDNEIARLENFPQLNRVHTLLFNNNHISKINEDIGSSLPNLHTLILSNNRIMNLQDLDPLVNLPSLKYLSLLDNICSKKQNYRLYLIHIIPSLKVIDFRKIKKKEREESKTIFGTSPSVLKKLKEIENDQNDNSLKSKTFVPGEGLNGNNHSIKQK